MDMIIFDLDCLSDDSHRRHFIDPNFSDDYEYSNFGKDPITREMTTIDYPTWHRKDNVDSLWKPNYSAYNAACDGDKPLPYTWFLFNWLPQLQNVEIWSSQPESCRAKLIPWFMRKCPLRPTYWDEESWNYVLKLRPDETHTEPQEEMYEYWADLHKYLREEDPIETIFSSHKPTIDMFRRRGVFVFDCNQSET